MLIKFTFIKTNLIKINFKIKKIIVKKKQNLMKFHIKKNQMIQMNQMNQMNQVNHMNQMNQQNQLEKTKKIKKND